MNKIYKTFHFRSAVLILILFGMFPINILAFQHVDSTQNIRTDSPYTSRLNLHFQSTYIYQYKPRFASPYSGSNSLSANEEKKNSITASLYFGSRLWKGGELYINPEVAGGNGLSGAFGMAASTNGETFRVGDPSPTLYVARTYFTQTFEVGGREKQLVPEGPNETGGFKPKNYLKFYLGKMSLGDLFDNNGVSNSPRTQFLNWCLMSNGAWDYAADLRGYTYCFATVFQYGPIAYKFSLATLPVVANGIDLNTNLGQEFGLNGQVEKSYGVGLFNRPGTIRLLGYYNYGHMGNYARAMQDAAPGAIPDLISTRKNGRYKTGLGLNCDQQVASFATVFFRAGWNDGQNETWCFTEADETLSGGISIKGNPWYRNDDNLGIALAVNGLSKNHREYIAAGGLGFQIGDGQLNYANETVLETYYSYKPPAYGFCLSLDYQLALNPGYNSDRGPVNVFSFRLHVEL